jgi:arylsulfatase A-like enzyme
MVRRFPSWLVFPATFALLAHGFLAKATAEDLPNIVLILADDLGYGDLRCYNPQAKVATPHVDRLAAEGMRWTDAHSPSTVCTPTRYGLMTGQMPFRIPRGSTVFTGVGGPSLIAPERLTLPEMLLQKGYATAAVGKWHMGLTFRDAMGNAIKAAGNDGVRLVDPSRRIEGGPLDHGFQKFFGTACCPTTDWLYAFIDGDRIPVPPIMPLPRDVLPKNPYTEDCRPGWIAADFDMQEVDQRFLEQSLNFIRHHVRQSPRKPFFLYHATQAVHLPSLPGKDFRGKTQAGPHGDFIAQFDSIVGALMKELEKQGIAERTLVLLSSDNGPEVAAAIHMRADFGHDAAKPWRGVKRDAWEGGHRVPFIVRWPSRIKGGSKCDHLASLTDVMATLAEVAEYSLPHDAAEDSFSLLPAFQGKAAKPVRPYLLTQAFRGIDTLSLRRGSWKLMNHRDSGGNRYDQGELQPYALPESDSEAPAQLYDLAADPGETNNLFSKRQDVVRELQELLSQTIKSGRSRP